MTDNGSDDSTATKASKAYYAINRLAKWRSFLAGWQLGTRPKGDPECDAVRDHREITLVMRAEMNAVTRLLIAKGIVTEDELHETFAEEATALSESYSQRFKGFEAGDEGLVVTDAMAAVETLKGWKP